MNSYQANNLDLPDLLSRLGHEPVAIKKGGNELWYKSPFREEDEPSFHISKGNKWAWVWNDFADAGGTVIDFVMRHQGHRDLKKALNFLDSIYGQRYLSGKAKRVGEQPSNQPTLFSFHGQQAAKPPKFSENGALEFISAHPISNPLIYTYLKGRGIAETLANRFLLEVKYRNKGNNREYFAFGMENQSGGYEIRAASDEYKFKSALKQRDITTIAGTASGAKAVCVFEGMTDFLSYLVLMNMEHPSKDCIIMHSLSSFQRTVEFIRQQDYTVIHTFLDNNPPGLKYTEKFIETFSDRVTPQSALFAPHVDLNDALLANANCLIKEIKK